MTSNDMNGRHMAARIAERMCEWNIVVENSLETESSVLAFGRRENISVVLKVIREKGDEWLCGNVLRCFDGIGTVRVYESIEGAVLLERLDPGTQLAGLSLQGEDDEATTIIAELIRTMSERPVTAKNFVTVEDWGRGFERYRASGDQQIPRDLVERAENIYVELSRSQKRTRLLHGDLQHYNVLFDHQRGWVAIDPKGVIGEVEYEVGASLRNPYEQPSIFLSTERIERRIKLFAEALSFDADRALAWGYAQAVLSAIWSVEDGFAVPPTHSTVMLARTIQTLCGKH